MQVLMADLRVGLSQSQAPNCSGAVHRTGRESNNHGMPHLLPWAGAPPLKLILCRVCNEEVIGLAHAGT